MSTFNQDYVDQAVWYSTNSGMQVAYGVVLNMINENRVAGEASPITMEGLKEWLEVRIHKLQQDYDNNIKTR